MAQTVNNGSVMNNTTNRLATIATRQRKSRARDVMFAAFIALATVISFSSVAAAAEGASTQIVSR